VSFAEALREHGLDRACWLQEQALYAAGNLLTPAETFAALSGLAVGTGTSLPQLGHRLAVPDHWTGFPHLAARLATAYMGEQLRLSHHRKENP
jgi:hypothetical protein